MRNVTIKRSKSFVACLGKMRVYIEDPLHGEIRINDIPCRKLGELKNGEEKTFETDGQAAKLFVIADTLTKDYCNEYYQLPEGDWDIFLTGKNKYNPAAGNPFRFDGNDAADVTANRKRGTRRGLVVLILAAIFGFIVGILGVSGSNSTKSPEPKTFSADGMTITLTDAFQKTDIDGFTVTYDSSEVAVFCLKEPFSLMDGLENYTLEQYAELVVQANGLSLSDVENVDGIPRFTYSYTNPDTGDAYRFFTYLYKSSDAFWMVQFAVLQDVLPQYEQPVRDWARSVTFSD